MKPSRVSGRLLIIGDSVSLGATDVRGNEVLSRVERSYVQQIVAQLPDVEVIVDADVHRITGTAKEKLPDLLAQHRPEIVLLMIGGNDAEVDWKRFVISQGKVARSRVPAERYQANLRVMVEQVRSASAIPVLADFPLMCITMRGVYLSKLANLDLIPLIEQGGGQAEVDRQRLAYENAVAEISRQHDVLLSRFGAAMKPLGAAAMVSEDGIHPNQAAHDIIAQILIPTLTRAFHAKQGAVTHLAV